jgi:hypothetical protein
MAKLTATTYDDLYNVLTDENVEEAVIGNNTTAFLNQRSCEIETVKVALHGSVIAVLYANDKVAFSLAGYPTVTTRERINQFLPSGYKVVQRGGVQFVSLPDGTYKELNPLRTYTIYGTHRVNGYTVPARIAMTTSVNDL